MFVKLVFSYNNKSNKLAFVLFCRNATLQGYLDEKDGRNARILVNLLAIRLNRLEPMDEAAKNKHGKMRHALLCVLDQLPVRDEVNFNSQLVENFST